MVVMESVSVVALRLPNIEWRAAVMYQVSLTLMIPTSPGGWRVFAREVSLGGRTELRIEGGQRCLQIIGQPEVGRVVAREIVAVRQGEGFKRRHSEELDTHIFEIPYRP
jgi:hypothetical protein